MNEWGGIPANEQSRECLVLCIIRGWKEKIQFQANSKLPHTCVQWTEH